MTFYRRNLPHLQRDAKPHFLTFVTYRRWMMPAWARSIVFDCCLHDREIRYQLHAAVVMPDHVHLILTPLTSKEKAAVVTLAEIMQGITGYRDTRWFVDGDNAVAFYVLDAYGMSVDIAERFVVRAGEIQEIEAIFELPLPGRE